MFHEKLKKKITILMYIFFLSYNFVLNLFNIFVPLEFFHIKLSKTNLNYFIIMIINYLNISHTFFTICNIAFIFILCITNKLGKFNFKLSSKIQKKVII